MRRLIGFLGLACLLSGVAAASLVAWPVFASQDHGHEKPICGGPCRLPQAGERHAHPKAPRRVALGTATRIWWRSFRTNSRGPSTSPAAGPRRTHENPPQGLWDHRHHHVRAP